MNDLMTGYCEYCGDPRQVMVNTNATQEEANVQATKECDCEMAKKEREKEAQRVLCEKNIQDLLRCGFPEIADIFLEALGCIQAGVMKSISVDTGMGKKARLSWTRDGIKVELAESRKTEKTA